MRLDYKILISLSSLMLVYVLQIHSIVSANKHLKINPELLENKWNAHWISCPGVSLTDFGVFHFRKTFDLRKKPDEFIIHVSGDNRYRLYVNGIEVCNGPARGDLANWRFDTVDISRYLGVGENILAVVVWNFGEFRPLAQMSNKTAFILQGNDKLEAVVNTGRTWKVYRNEAYHIPLTKNNTVGPGEIIDGGKYPFGWEKIDFDDDVWLIPKLLGKGVPNGKFATWNWNLVPRNIPFMEHKLQRIIEIERTDDIIVEKGFLTGEAPITIQPNNNVKILLDQTYLTTAYPVLIVSGGKGSSIEINYAETMVDKNGIAGNRNVTQNKEMLSNYFDIFRPDGGMNRRFQPLWFRTYRYLELTITTKGEPLKISDIYGYFTAYPFEEKAYFHSDNSKLKDIWDVGWRTARLCAGETYYDCPYYEQLQYIGDTRIQALISLYVAGDDRLMRNAIEQFHNSLLPIGLTQSRYPSYQPQVIPTFSLIWIYMVHDYWMHRDDAKFVKKYLNGIKNVLYWYEQHIADNGILGPMNWWNFVDWSFAQWNSEKPRGGVPDGGIEGYSSVITLQYVLALQKAIELLEFFDEQYQAEYYRGIASSLIKNIYKHCWSEEKGLLADTPEKNSFSQHANIFAILTNMLDGDKGLKLSDRILKDKELTQATYYFQFYLIRALIKAGKANDYLSLLSPWEEMINLGLTTFAEMPEPTRSDCHAWSAHPSYDLLATVCGITPGYPGFKMVKIQPRLGDLKFIDCKLPHPNGDILMNLNRKGQAGVEGEVILPEGLHGEFLWNDKTVKLRSGMQRIKIL